MSTITEDPQVLMQAKVPESLRRHIKVQAAMAGKEVHEWLADILAKHTGYEPPKEPARA